MMMMIMVMMIVMMMVTVKMVVMVMAHYGWRVPSTRQFHRI